MTARERRVGISDRRPCNARRPVGVLWLTLHAALALTLAASAHAYSPVEIRTYVSAVSAMRQGRVQIAATRVREGLRSVPESSLLNNIAGAIYMALGDAADADAAWRRVATAQPEEPVAAYGRGLVALSRRRWDEAASLLRLAAQHGDRASCMAAQLYADILRGTRLADTISLPDGHWAARLALEAHAAWQRGDYSRALTDARMALDLHHGARYAEPQGMLMRFDPSSPLRPGVRMPSPRPILDFDLGNADPMEADPSAAIWRMIELEPSRAALAKIGSRAAEAVGDPATARRLGGLAIAIDAGSFSLGDAVRMVAGPYRSPEPLWSAPTSRRLVALTFDDGPRRDPTERLVGILRRFNARATFFVTGRYAAANPDVVADLARNGMEVANHSYSHAAMPTLKRHEVMRELMQTSACVQDITGRAPAFFRPPGGRSSDSVLAAVGALGMRACMWTVNAREAELRSARAVYDEVVGQVRPGAVVLMHNGPTATTKALPEIIVALRRKGYEFVTVSELARNGT